MARVSLTPPVIYTRTMADVTPPQFLVHAYQLLELHEDATRDGYRASTYPAERIDELATEMVRAASPHDATTFNKYNRSYAIFIARGIVQASRRGTTKASRIWCIEILDLNPHSPSCGNWYRNPAVTGPPTDDEEEINGRLNLIAAEGHVVQLVREETTRRVHRMSPLPWNSPAAGAHR